MFGDRPNRQVLIGPPSDLMVDAKRVQGPSAGSPLHQQGQLISGVKALHPARRIAGVVPQMMLVAVAGKDHRALTGLVFQTIGIELGLLLTGTRVDQRLFGFDDAEWQAVGTPEHIVDIANAAGRRHAMHFNFDVSARCQVGPPGLGEQRVDLVPASLGFGPVMCFDRRRLGHTFRLGHLTA